MGAKLTGDWDLLSNKLNKIGGALKSETDKRVGRNLKKVERTVLSHIDEQDLDWDPLTDATAKRKKNKGLSPDILRASNEMYQNITTRQDEAWTGMVGVTRGVKSKDGEEVTDIALIHEQPEDDGEIIPARKLWKPTFEELKAELAAELQGGAIKVFKK